MKHYQFEYTDQKFTIKLLSGCALLFTVLLVAAILLEEQVNLVLALAIAGGLPLLVFYLYKKRIKQQGEATLFESYVTFLLSGESKKMDFNEIEMYQIERFRGTALKLRSKNGEKLAVQANDNFCKPEQFDFFCTELDTAIQQYKTEHNNTHLKRKKSIFEQAWMLPLLIGSTAIIAVVGFVVVFYDVEVPSALFSFMAAIIPLWIGYFDAKKRKV